MEDHHAKITKAIEPYLLHSGFILTDLPKKELERLRESAVVEKRKRGEILFRQGAYPKGAFWVMSGKLKIFQETPAGLRQTLYVYTDGDLAGYRQIIANEVYAVTG